MCGERQELQLVKIAMSLIEAGGQAEPNCDVGGGCLAMAANRGADKCEMKDGKSCCDGKNKNMKAAMKGCKKNLCCAGGKCCPEGNSCSEAKGDTTAMGCCGSKCERHPQTPAGSVHPVNTSAPVVERPGFSLFACRPEREANPTPVPRITESRLDPPHPAVTGLRVSAH